ncbi:MAG TPA: hypothetical protein VFO83_16450 [Aggregicoccus sp.]|nr:hypothetical protein [Aggregicoccus sp.]
MLDDARHAACVDAWLEGAARGLPPGALVRLFEAALAALWACTETTLGEVTLSAIAERVLLNAAERDPLFASLAVEPGRGIRCQELREQAGSAQGAQLLQGIRLVLVELITVLGNLTAEILTPELHEALSGVTVDTQGEDKGS